MTDLLIDYTNWRGERRVRRIRPNAIRFAASPPWHPDKTWLLTAQDMDTGEQRDFAMVCIHSITECRSLPRQSGRSV